MKKKASHIVLAFYCVILIVNVGAIAKENVFSANPAAIDTARLLSDKPVKSPWGAVLRSAVLPGWGQVYNKKYIKGVFAASLDGVLFSQILHNQNQWEKTGDRNFFNRRNDFYWYFGISYLLTLVDAYVDAYLFGFNKAMDIGLSPPGRGDKPVMLTVQITL